MIDLVVLAALLGLVIRGWMRGFLREAIGLATLVVGLVLALRLSTPLSGVVRAVGGVSPEVARLIAGIVIFTGVSVAGALLARIGRRGIALLPGMPTVDRLAGAALAGGAGLLAATVVLSVLTVLPLPAAVAEPLAESRVAGTLTDPTGTAQRALDIASGDGVLGVVLRIDEIVGSPRVGDPGDEVVMLPPVDDEDLVFAPRQTVTLRNMVNRERVTADLSPLATAERLDDVARRHAAEMYRNGRMAHVTESGTGPSDRLDAAGVRHVVVAELIGLGESPEAVVQAWMRDDRSRATLLTPDVTRMGVAAYRGPAGSMLVMVATG